ncbi:MAG: GerW family sporulation protein [Bacillota bacterium]
MTTAMESIKQMVDVNTIVGDAVQAPDGTVIIPISKVTFGFAAGGGEYEYQEDTEEAENDRMGNEDNGENSNKFPFAGGSGAGVSINPVAFMVAGNGHIKLLPVNINSTADKILDLVPELLCRLESLCKKRVSVKKEKEKVEKGEKGEKEEKEEDE